MRARYFLRVALRNILHSGQRALVAVLCITFGVLSLVAMTHLERAIETVLLTDPRAAMGGDLSVYTHDYSEIGADWQAKLVVLKEEGALMDYTLIAKNYSLAFRREGSGQLFFLNNGVGIDPKHYPLIGTLQVAILDDSQRWVDVQPADLPTLLGNTGDLLVTQDLARQYNLYPGDRLFLSDLENGVPLLATIRGIIADQPSHLGGQVFYNLETAKILVGGSGVVIDTALVLASPAQSTAHPDPASIDALTKRLEGQGWSAYSALDAEEGNRNSREFFNISLKAAGILGLLVGCIGIANTMQVLLAQRKREVAIFKTMGYASKTILSLFLFEALILGTAGSLMGILLGELVYAGLLNLFTNTVNMLLTWSPAPDILLNGLWIGILTSLLFAWTAIIRASAVRPSVILRSEALETNLPSRLKLLGMVLVLAIPFTLTASLIMGSALKGVGVVLFALIGLLLLGGMMAGTIWLITRLIPGGVNNLSIWGGLLNLARSSLQRRGLNLVFAMIAMFIGVVTLTLAGVVTIGAQDAMSDRSVQLSGDNLMVIADPSEETAVRQAIQDNSPEHFTVGYELPVRQFILPDNIQGSEYGRIYPILIGRDQPADFQLSGAPWGSVPGGVYAAQHLNLPTGTLLTVELGDGTLHKFEVAGSYQLNFEVNPYRTHSGLLMSSDQLHSLGDPQSMLAFARFPANRLASAAEKLGLALPRATVLNTLAYYDRFVATYHNLFIFALAMSSLSLLAGILLIANAVSLALIHRRIELAILAALGYTRQHILGALALEYVLAALAAGIMAAGAVQVFLLVMGWINQTAANLLQLNWPTALGGILAGMLLTLATVLAIAWQPTRESPAAGLNI